MITLIIMCEKQPKEEEEEEEDILREKVPARARAIAFREVGFYFGHRIVGPIRARSSGFLTDLLH